MIGCLGPKLPGGIRMIKDERKVEAALKKTLSKDYCTQGFNGGWAEESAVAVKAFNNSPQADGRIRIFYYHYCEGAYEASVAMVRPSRSSRWYLIPVFMNHVDAAQTYGQWGTGDSSLDILGYNDWDGGGRAPALVHITLSDDKSNYGVKATQLKQIDLPGPLDQ